MTQWVGRAALVLACIGTAAGAQAQDTMAGSDPPLAGLQQALEQGDRLTVTLIDGTKGTGRFATASSDEISLVADGRPTRISAAQVLRVQRRRTGIVLGAAVGGSIGLACGLALGSLFSNEGANPTGPVLSLTAVGLGVGAGLDALINLPRTVYRRGSLHAMAGVDVTPSRAGVRLALSF
jgi:hypothetical protein